jgi:hypothetical protein
VLKEALQSPFLTLEDEESDYGETRPVTDLIDNVLSSVRVVRAASAFGRAEEQARFSWTSLIIMLGIAISENTHLAYGIKTLDFCSVLMSYREDVSFLLPRTKARTTPSSSDDLEGKAVVLLSTFIPRSSRPSLDSGGSDKMESGPSTACEYLSVYSPRAISQPFLTRIASDGCSEDPFVSLDLPLSAYVTPGRGKRVDCCLPVICVADEDEIGDLVTSVVCQRFVWNIPIPVIGVSLSKLATTGKIVIGWSEVDSSNPDAPVGISA